MLSPVALIALFAAPQRVSASALQNGATPAAADQANGSEPKDQEFRRIMDAGDLPGLSVVRIVNSRVAWSRQLGRRAAMDAVVNATPIDRETVFEAASLGKPVVAIAALWLHDRHRLNLDEPAETVVPYAKLDDPRKTSITPRMLMSHTSGLAFVQPKLEAEPGNRYSYSTEGYRYLQRIVEKRLGEPLELWAQRTLFGPLQMDRSSFTFAERFAGNRATGRNWLDRGQEYMTNAAGAGAFDLITTADDYAKLWAALLRGEVLSSESLRLMFTPQKPITSASNDPSVPKTEPVDLAAGLGLLLQRRGAGWLGFQWGDNGGSTGFLIVDPNLHDAVVFLSNAQDGLHAGQAIVAATGMADDALGWVGYTAFDTPARVAWKRITGRLNVDCEAGLAEYKRLLAKDRKTVAPLSRNLGYYNKFRGFVVEAEPFFRVAVEENPKDADLYEVWSESLVADGRVEAAAEAQQRAIDLDASRLASLKLPEWVRVAKRDLANPAPPDREGLNSHAGRYGDLSFELSAAADLTVVRDARPRRLIQVKPGEYLASDLTSRFTFAPNKVTVLDAGKDPVVLYRKSAQ